MRLPKITGAFLNLTQKCNLKCEYCFVHQKPLQMNYQVAKDSVDFLAKNALEELRIPSINFFGGEPLLKYDEIIKQLVEYIRSTYGDYEIGITTNGTLLTEDKLKFFKDNNVSILLSIDGDKKTQNLLRPYHNGNGSFDDINIKIYLEYYPNATFRATLDPRNVEYLYDNYLWGEEMGYTNATFIANSFENWTDEKINLLKINLDKITNRIIEKIKNKEFYMAFNEIEKMKHTDSLLNRINDNYFRDDGQELPACGTCGLGASVFGAIGSTGDIYSCQEMVENDECKEFIIGNIYSGMNDKKRIELVSKFNTRNVKCEKKERCSNCLLNKVCNGGCTINNYFKNNSLDVASEIWCIYQELCLIEYRKIKEVI